MHIVLSVPRPNKMTLTPNNTNTNPQAQDESTSAPKTMEELPIYRTMGRQLARAGP